MYRYFSEAPFVGILPELPAVRPPSAAGFPLLSIARSSCRSMRPGLREVRWVLRLIPAGFRLFMYSNTALLRYGLLVTLLGSGRVGVKVSKGRQPDEGRNVVPQGIIGLLVLIIVIIVVLKLLGLF